MRVLQAGGELDLALEPLDVDRGAHLGRQELDDDLPAEPDLLGQEDAAHAAATQLLQDAVVVADRGLKPVLEIDESAPVGNAGKLRAPLWEDQRGAGGQPSTRRGPPAPPSRPHRGWRPRPARRRARAGPAAPARCPG